MPSTLSGNELKGVERLQCPKHFQDRVTQIAGRNRYGQPNFKLAWAQTETMRQGGEWSNEEEHFVGYRDCYLGDGLPHWMLLQWADAGMNIQLPHLRPQSDVAFYAENLCLKTDLQILGEYSYHGSYQIALPLVAKWFEAGRLNIRAFPLSTEIVEMMVPIIKASMTISLETKLRMMREEKEQEDVDFGNAVDDAWNSVKLSAAAKSSEWIEDKVRSIESHFNSALITKMYRDRVFQSKHAL